MKVALLAVLLGCSFSMWAVSDETVTLSGSVKDPTGASIARATVVVHWNMPRANGPQKPNASDAVMNTDKFGEFSVNLKLGFYDVCVHAAGFSPTCDTVALGSGQGSSLKTVLKPNPLITNEYGDRFGEEMIVNPATVESPKLRESMPNPK